MSRANYGIRRSFNDLHPSPQEIEKAKSDARWANLSFRYERPIPFRISERLKELLAEMRQ